MDNLVDFQQAPIASFIFLLTVGTSIAAFYNRDLIGQLILHPASIVRGQRLPTIFTSGFIHADWMHLLFNMIAYTSFAYLLEAHILGHWQFMVVYLGSLILSSLATVKLHGNNGYYSSLGASGAVSGIVLSFVMFVPDAELLIFGIIPMPGWLFAIAYIGYSYYASKKQYDNIAHDAHLFGALAGILLTFLVKPEVIQYLQAWLGI